MPQRGGLRRHRGEHPRGVRLRAGGRSVAAGG
jgi:hypothetical protein